MTARSWRLDLPITKPMSMNDRKHHMVKARETARIRRDTFAVATEARIPALGTCTAELHYVPRDSRRRDADNLVATAKATFDALVDAGIVGDDTPEYMTKRMPVIDAADSSPRRSRVYLVVTEGLS